MIPLSSTLDSFSTCEQNEFIINIELNKVSKWIKLNKLSLNINKTKYILFKTTRRKGATSPLLKIDNTNIDRVLELNFLGINFNEQLQGR